jgi:hypothetical protein
MNILLDECLPRKLKSYIPGHDVMTVAEARWAGIKDAPLLRLAETRFDVFITDVPVPRVTISAVHQSTAQLLREVALFVVLVQPPPGIWS